MCCLLLRRCASRWSPCNIVFWVVRYQDHRAGPGAPMGFELPPCANVWLWKLCWSTPLIALASMIQEFLWKRLNHLPRKGKRAYHGLQALYAAHTLSFNWPSIH
jgi:hypothetical protein